MRRRNVPSAAHRGPRLRVGFVTNATAGLVYDQFKAERARVFKSSMVSADCESADPHGGSSRVQSAAGTSFAGTPSYRTGPPRVGGPGSQDRVEVPRSAPHVDDASGRIGPQGQPRCGVDRRAACPRLCARGPRRGSLRRHPPSEATTAPAPPRRTTTDRRAPTMANPGPSTSRAPLRDHSRAVPSASGSRGATRRRRCPPRSPGSSHVRGH